MSPGFAIRAPTTAAIPDSYKIPSTTRSLLRSISRLSRRSLIELALDWLKEGKDASCAPYLTSNRDLEEEAEEDYLYSPADNVEELRQIYETFKHEAGTKRDVIDRMLDGDWRRGISLQQLAMIDFQHLLDHEASLRWTALKLVPLSRTAEKSALPQDRHCKPPTETKLPCIQHSTFVQALKAEIGALVKAHYYLRYLPEPHRLTILRLFLTDTPYANPASATQSHFIDGARTIFIAFPDSCPYIYVSLSGSGGGGKIHGTSKIDAASMKRVVLEAVPKAFSRPHGRYALEATSLTARSLSTMASLRGNRRSGASQGVYTIFTDGMVDESPLEAVKSDFEGEILLGQDMLNEGAGLDSKCPLPMPPKRRALEERDANGMIPLDDDARDRKKKKMAVLKRFGTTGLANAAHKAPLDHLHIRLEERFRVSTAANTRGAAQQGPADRTRESSSTADRAGTNNQKGSDLSSSSHPQIPEATIALPAPPAKHPADSEQGPVAPLSLTFRGSDVIAGLRSLAETGLVDLDQMPAWMTGEEGMSGATVRGGVVVDGKGGGA